MSDLFTRTSQAIETRARLAFPANIWSWALVPEPLSIAEFKGLSRNTPLIALGWRGFKPSKQSGRKAIGTMTLRMTLVVKNERGSEHRFHGDPRGPGLFPALDMMVRILNGTTVPDLGTLLVTDANQAFAEGWDDLDAAIASIDIEMQVAFDGAVDAAAIDDFLTLQSAWVPTASAQNSLTIRP